MSDDSKVFTKAKRASSPTDDESWVAGEVSPTLNSFDNGSESRATVLAISENQRGELVTTDYAHQLVTGGGKPGSGYPAVMAFHPPQDPINGPVSPALGTTSGGMGIVQATAIRRLTERDHDDTPEPVLFEPMSLREENWTGREVKNALRAAASKSSHAVVEEHMEATNNFVVRRLTSTECERLMGWPDDHTRWRSDGTEQSDTARYKQCGNGVVSNVAEWIGRHILNAMSVDGDMGTCSRDPFGPLHPDDEARRD